MSSLAHNAGWVFLGQGLSLSCQAAYYILLARLLGATEYGIYMGVVALVSILATYSSLGSGMVFLRYVSPDHTQFARYWGNILMATVSLGSLFTALLAGFGPHITHAASIWMLACVAGGDCLCMQLAAATANVFQAFEQMRLTAGLNALTSFLRVALATALLVWLHHATAFQWAVAALAVSLCAATVAVVLVGRCFGKPSFSVSLLRQRVGEGFIYSLSSSAGNVYNDFDKVLLSHFGMNAACGIYSMAYKVLTVACMPIVSVNTSAFPRLFQRQEGGLRATSAYTWRILKRTGPLSLALIVTMWLAAPILPRLIGPSFAKSVSALRWLALIPLFRTFQWSAGDALTGAGFQRYRLGTQALAAAFNFGVNLYLIPRYGWYGAAWSSLATDGMLGALNWGVLLKVQAKSEA